MLKLLAAGEYGVHIGEIRHDALARLDQLKIGYDVFECARRGTGSNAAWVRFDPNSWFDIRIVADAAELEA